MYKTDANFKWFWDSHIASLLGDMVMVSLDQSIKPNEGNYLKKQRSSVN